MHPSAIALADRSLRASSPGQKLTWLGYLKNWTDFKKKGGLQAVL